MEQSTAGVRVGKSKFGRGVFARRLYRAGDVIGEITGEVMDDPDYGSDFCMDLGDNLTLEPAYPFRYLNHSCQPNCEIVQWQSEGDEIEADGRLWLHVLRAIRRGEELTIDYAWPADVAIPCRCRSRYCRGWIVAADQIHQLQVSRVAGLDRAGDYWQDRAVGSEV